MKSTDEARALECADDVEKAWREKMDNLSKSLGEELMRNVSNPNLLVNRVKEVKEALHTIPIDFIDNFTEHAGFGGSWISASKMVSDILEGRGFVIKI